MPFEGFFIPRVYAGRNWRITDGAMYNTGTQGQDIPPDRSRCMYGSLVEVEYILQTAQDDTNRLWVVRLISRHV